MNLLKLLANINYTHIQGNISRNITTICYDSRKVTSKSLFICINGANIDGHNFINSAIKKGATTIILENYSIEIPHNITVIKVKNTRKILSLLCARFFGEPANNMNVIGITGTNGKTSTSYYIQNILQHLNTKVGVIGTIKSCINDEELTLHKNTSTTPLAFELHQTLAIMKKRHVKHVCLEVTSHALDQNRVDDCPFKIGVFTNLTHDHLDYHKTLENYKNAKLKLFDMSENGVINIDDPIAQEILIKPLNSITYGIDNPADIQAFAMKNTFAGVSFKLKYFNEIKNITFKMPGKIYIYNLLASIAVCHLLGYRIDDIIAGISNIKGVTGRFEIVKNNLNKNIIIDYAHTPDALEKTLQIAQELSPKRVITVFGCEGNRDVDKRPLMGKIAARYSDYFVITSDNPRYEDPHKIINDIEVGVGNTSHKYSKFVNRRQAIYNAIAMANADDILLICGKGHEKDQIISDKIIKISDYDIITDYQREQLEIINNKIGLCGG